MTHDQFMAKARADAAGTDAALHRLDDQVVLLATLAMDHREAARSARNGVRLMALMLALVIGGFALGYCAVRFGAYVAKKTEAVVAQAEAMPRGW